MMTPQDKEMLEKKGISEKQIEEKIDLLEKGIKNQKKYKKWTVLARIKHIVI